MVVALLKYVSLCGKKEREREYEKREREGDREVCVNFEVLVVYIFLISFALVLFRSFQQNS